MDYLDFILVAQKLGEPRGIPSICSAHLFVLKAAFRHGLAQNNPVLVEATCNQVNQFGGYTGMTPAEFVTYVHGIAAEANYPLERLILGGDHLGPNVWQNEPTASAMQKSINMVQAYVRAGFTKIHLDASMRLADDSSGGLSPELIAKRTAQLAKAAEEAAPDKTRLRYVIGTEVPVPGGAFVGQEDEGLHITLSTDVEQTIEMTRCAFNEEGLEAAWQRVMAVVVQPGVEFGDDFVLEFRPEAANGLSKFIETKPNLIYEAHSTDYQTRQSLHTMVCNHFAILKVGPGLTFSFREAVFALATIEKELFQADLCSNLPQVLNKAALRRPEYWMKYYRGTSEEQAFKRKYSLSDRIRYYWSDPIVQKAFMHLLNNFGNSPLPLTLLSQYLPGQYTHIRNGCLQNNAHDILLDRVMDVLEDYEKACSFQGVGK
ncbi:MAG: class II D-tagatose-bisphosphate aldolase, non-catalytic subunit [Anaerolineaceae bacterium]|nr:class II D-tagatose-bisphosphate aldolase, non-catalytic subunit [Anaerolineaceae bacterium]